MRMLAFAVCSCGLALAGCNSSTTSDRTPVSATKEVVKRQDLVGYQFFNGKLVIPATADATAFSPYSTSVVSVSTSIGKFVRRGEPIVKLAIPGAEDAARSAQLGADSAKSALAEQRADASGPVIDAQRALAEARAAEEAAKQTVAQGGSADVDAATQDRKDAEAALAQAKQQLRETLQPTKDVLRASVSDLQAARADARKGIVRAPISGTVVSLDAKAGLAVSPTQPLARIVNFAAARVQGVVPPELKAQIRKNMRVIVAMSEPSEDPVDGTVVDVSVIPPRVNQQSPGYLAVIALDSPRSLPAPPAGVKRIGIKTGTARQVPVVPVGALFAKDGKTAVSVLKDGQWVDTVVTTGLTDGVRTEIKSGIDEGAVVRVVAPAERTAQR